MQELKEHYFHETFLKNLLGNKHQMTKLLEKFDIRLVVNMSYSCLQMLRLKEGESIIIPNGTRAAQDF